MSQRCDQLRKFNIFTILQSAEVGFLLNSRRILQAFIDIKKCFEQSVKMLYSSKICKFELLRVFTKSLAFQSLHAELLFSYFSLFDVKQCPCNALFEIFR